MLCSSRANLGAHVDVRAHPAPALFLHHACLLTTEAMLQWTGARCKRKQSELECARRRARLSWSCNPARTILILQSCCLPSCGSRATVGAHVDVCAHPAPALPPQSESKASWSAHVDVRVELAPAVLLEVCWFSSYDSSCSSSSFSYSYYFSSSSSSCSSFF